MPNQNRGMLLRELGDLPAVLAALDAAVGVAPDDAYLRRTRVHCRVQAGQLAGALEDFSRATTVQPELAKQYSDRAAVYERLGQPALAEQDRAAASRLRT